MSVHQSATGSFWKRLLRKPGAIVALLIISITLFIAVTAYWIAPDNSPDANLQCVEIQAQSPGYQQQFVLLPLQNISASPPSQWHQWWLGKPLTSQAVPITMYRLEKDSLIVNRLIDAGITERMAIANTVFKKDDPTSNPLHAIVNKRYWLGTDKFGRDILSRLLVGSRVSLSVGVIALFISLTVGVLLGALAGYYRGWTDRLIMWLINVTWSIPTLLLVFAITLALGKGFWQIFLAVGLTMWVNVARLVRGQVMSIREMEYVQAAKVIGLSNTRIIRRHILPNMAGPLMVIGAGNFATAIIVEAGLSFLGIGVQAPQPSWGLMIKENYNFIITHHPLLALIPGFAIMLLVLAFNLLGNALRDVLDVRSQS